MSAIDVAQHLHATTDAVRYNDVPHAFKSDSKGSIELPVPCSFAADSAGVSIFQDFISSVTSSSTLLWWNFVTLRMPPCMVELCNVTNATIPGGILFFMKTLKVPCSVELINVTSPPFWVALHNVKKCHHERVDELSHI